MHDVPAPRGRGPVFAKQASGFWTVTPRPLHPSLDAVDLRSLTIWTLEFWLGWLLGKKCKQRCVRYLQRRHGWTEGSHWFEEYGAWSQVKPGLEDQVRRYLRKIGLRPSSSRGGCQATYFNHKKRLPPPADPPCIRVQNPGKQPP